MENLETFLKNEEKTYKQRVTEKILLSLIMILQVLALLFIVSDYMSTNTTTKSQNITIKFYDNKNYSEDEYEDRFEDTKNI